MDVIRAIIIDDEVIHRRWIHSLAASHPVLEIIGQEDGGDGTVAALLREKPDVIFLDVRLASRTGFDLLNSLPSPPKVVFVTSSRDHALQAFEAEAVDYLVKPVSRERFAAAVNRLQKAFDAVIVSTPYARTDRICLRSVGKSRVVPISGLVWLKAEGNFSHIACADGSVVLMGKLLREYEESLPSPPFVRLDRSLIINQDRWQSMERKTRDQGLIFLEGASSPLEIGRTAMQRLNDLVV